MSLPNHHQLFEANKYSSTKKRMQDQAENNLQRSKKTLKYPDSHGLHYSTMKEDDQMNLNRDILRLNSQLQYIRISPFNHFRGCSQEHLSELYQIVDSLLALRNQDKDKIKNAQNLYHKSELQKNRQIRKNESLMDQVNRLRVEKDELIERIKGIHRDFKTKEQKYLKEREIYQKERKATESRQQAIKNEFKKKEDKILTLETKLKKQQQKNNKTDYRVVFDVKLDLDHKGDNQKISLAEREGDALVLKAIRDQGQFLEKQNGLLKNYIGSLFENLYRIVECNPEEIQNKDQFCRCLSLLEFPFQQAQGFVDKMKNLTDKIYSMIYQQPDAPNLLSAGKSNEQNLGFALERMKHYFKNAQKVEEQRSKLSIDLFSILNKTDQLTKPVIQNVNNVLSNPPLTGSPQFEEEIDKLRKQQEIFAEDDKKVSQSIAFIRQQMQFMSRRSSFISTIHRQVNQAMGIGEDESLL